MSDPYQEAFEDVLRQEPARQKQAHFAIIDQRIARDKSELATFLDRFQLLLDAHANDE